MTTQSAQVAVPHIAHESQEMTIDDMPPSSQMGLTEIIGDGRPPISTVCVAGLTEPHRGQTATQTPDFSSHHASLPPLGWVPLRTQQVVGSAGHVSQETHPERALMTERRQFHPINPGFYRKRIPIAEAAAPLCNRYRISLVQVVPSCQRSCAAPIGSGCQPSTSGLAGGNAAVDPMATGAVGVAN